jgi:hypothetical protein
MSNPSIRRAQLIAPFGVGALYTGEDGRAIIGAGLDHWFKNRDGSTDGLDLDEYRVEEWRLEQILGVSHFRLPPDFRRKMTGGESGQENLGLTIPFLTFPLWHVCPWSSCRRLWEASPSDGSRRRCDACAAAISAGGKSAKNRKRAPYLVPVRFIAICEEGHIQDFPWRDWVHRTKGSQCTAPMRLRARGGESLASQWVECGCGVGSRNLGGITSTSGHTKFRDRSVEDTIVSTTLTREGRYECAGARPWLAEVSSGTGCGAPLRGSLRAALNVYYAHVASAIYLPRTSLGYPSALNDVLRDRNIRIKVVTAIQNDWPITAKNLKDNDDYGELEPYPEEQVALALDAYIAELREGANGIDASGKEAGDFSDIRLHEHEKIRESLNESDLRIRKVPIANYSKWVQEGFDRVNLVDELRETRVLHGFSRIRPESTRSLQDLRSMLWRREPDANRTWLPAYIVKGEGIYLELNEKKLRGWEKRPAVASRLDVILRNPDPMKTGRGLEDPDLVPRFVLIHTLAHVLMNQLTFECGYSSASLRERLFCAAGTNPMAGFMIYTAAGDSEGTMGGLVRMGRPTVLDAVLEEALSRARWCSSDPVCMELGEHGQGPNSCNLAACHSCALVPETSCENFNKYLDRALLIGTPDEPEVGFFTGM